MFCRSGRGRGREQHRGGARAEAVTQRERERETETLGAPPSLAPSWRVERKGLRRLILIGSPREGRG